jgi:hypothetical protein
VCLVAFPFFHAGAGDNLVDACLELALTYHCSPREFLERPAREIAEIWSRTKALTARRRQEQDAED